MMPQHPHILSPKRRVAPAFQNAYLIKQKKTVQRTEANLMLFFA